MGDKSAIAWTEATWNCLTGCSRVSPGCQHCYAEQLAATRLAHLPAYTGTTRETTNGSRWTGRINLVEDKLTIPLRWAKPRMIFVNSMSDCFHPRVPISHLARMFAVMVRCPQHTFQILTKRAEGMHALLNNRDFQKVVWEEVARLIQTQRPPRTEADESLHWGAWPIPNIWLGVSAEDQKNADQRVPLLQRTPAAVRFVSYEPALGPIDFQGAPECEGDRWWLYDTRTCDCPLNGPDAGKIGEMTEIPGLDWIIVGAESGPGHRPFDLEWARSVLAQCREAGTAFFMKQDGGLHSGRYDHLPDDLKVREFPEPRR